MKKAQLLFVLILMPLLSFAQTKVHASEVIAKINRGEAVVYKDVEIIGDLDMTKLGNMKLKKEGKKDSKGETKEYISTVKAPVSFTNCTFKGDVLAYFNPNNGEGVNIVNIGSGGEVYNTNFEGDVKFENCAFEEETAFKYSEFNGNVSFAGSRFNEEALFKYSKFPKSVDFSKVKFGEAANFKYVKFPEMPSFQGASFEEEANFKYAKFEEGVNFQDAAFNGLANFKYAKLSDAVKLKGASFNRGSDFKYTKLNNRSVSLSTLQNK